MEEIFSVHRRADESFAQAQEGNRSWWTRNPMDYDWKNTIRAARFSKEWFAEVDRRFLDSARPYLTHVEPFDRILPQDLQGKDVLEIGCGMGLHTTELASRGANVTAIDLTELAVEATTARLEMMGLPGTVVQSDAELLPFDDKQFDLVWSWGVIHHSSSTARIVRQMARVLRNGGESRIMVYNRDSLLAWLVLLRYYLLGAEFRKRSSDEVLWAHSDGFIARHYTADQLADLIRGFFEDVSVTVLGQEVDVVPLPSMFRKLVVSRLSEESRVRAADRRGFFLFSVAKNPLPSPHAA